MQGGRRGNVAFTVVVTALVCLGALPVLLLLAVSGAPSSLLLATVLAALPVGPLVACYLWLDRYEPEPRWLLAFGLASITMAAIPVLAAGVAAVIVGRAVADTVDLGDAASPGKCRRKAHGCGKRDNLQRQGLGPA